MMLFSDKFKEKFSIGYKTALDKGAIINTRKAAKSIFNTLQKEDNKILKRERKARKKRKFL